jgi:signal transduction histidine kinase
MGIRGNAAILEKNGMTPEQERFVRKIAASAATIQHQMEFTRLYQEIGGQAPSWQGLGETVRKARMTLPMAGLLLIQEGVDHDVRADPMFEKVIYNLIENCIRHSGGARQLRVSAVEDAGNLVISLEDDGKGLSEEDRRHLFERGYGKNTGFGLFLSREILSITGISIVEDGHPGGGARFVMRVPPGDWRPGQH